MGVIKLSPKYRIHDGRIFYSARKILKQTYGDDADFREGQYEAIESVMMRKRTLVVQRTGWGKSLVYFISAKMLRKKKRNLTMVVSPLLVLMDNQREMAEKLNLKCDVLNSTVKDRRAEIIDSLIHDELDVIFVTPETLFASDIQSSLHKIKVGLFVIDEAHCISDWGHDFRLEYGKLGRIISAMPANVSVLAVTATANDRVVNDLRSQLGDDVYVSRGKLTRESLHIQILRLDTRAKRYAWLLENLNKLPGTGIIYCLTRRNCEELSEFLNAYGLNTMPYYSGNDEKLNEEAIEKFHGNKIKAVIATVKLGMGYDKGDISFVIHYQTPANIVSYYQQIGREGRNIPEAYAFLMAGGDEDERIINFFINTAFPSERESREIYNFIAFHEGITLSKIISSVNINQMRITKALDFLENDGFIYRSGGMYYSSAKRFSYDRQHYREITLIRKKEIKQMQALVKTKECYSKFIVNCLDDNEKNNCGRCSNCLGHHVYPGLTLKVSTLKIAVSWLNSGVIAILPLKIWPYGKKIEHVNMDGICLSKYGASGYGALVREGKYETGRFSDELVERSAEVLSPIVKEKLIRHIAFVPSLRSDIVKDFAERLASRMKLRIADVLIKAPAAPQKNMESSMYQYENARKSFSVKNVRMPFRVLLIDDIVDSKWTLTVCGYKLMEAGCYEVYPFALADSSEGQNI